MRHWIDLVESYHTTVFMQSDYGGQGDHVEVFKNPSRSRFMRELKDLDHKVARGNLYPDGTLMVFFVEDAEHHPMSDALGMGHNFIRLFLAPDRVTFYGDEFDDPMNDMDVSAAIEMLKAAPALQKIYGRDFEVVED